MSKFDTLKDLQSVTAEQKLAIVGHEFVRQIAIVNGYATLLKEFLSETIAKKDISEDCSDWISKILEASDDMSEILNIMTSNPE